MNTKLLMTLSSTFMAILGLVLSFLPLEILVLAGVSGPPTLTPLVQIAGALYLGFATLNWMAKESLLGGIYGRPVVLANFGHFTVGAIALLKGVLGGQPAGAAGLSVAYTAFAIWFAATLFGSPVNKATASVD